MNALEYFKRKLEMDGKAELTIRAYSDDAKQCLAFINKPLLEITKLDINEYLYSIIELEISTRCRKIASVKLFFEFTADVKLTNDIIGKIKLPVGKVEKQYIPTNDEIKQLLSVANNKMKAIILTYISTSCRFEELQNLTLNDIEQESTTIIGKGQVARKVFFNQDCKHAINEYLNKRVDNENSILFTSGNGQPLDCSVLNRSIKALAKKANLANWDKFSNHAFRRFFATNLFAKKVDSEVIRSLMGHSPKSRVLFEHYVDIKDEMKMEAINLI